VSAFPPISAALVVIGRLAWLTGGAQFVHLHPAAVVSPNPAVDTY
jgi:hypothetical protein